MEVYRLLGSEQVKTFKCVPLVRWILEWVCNVHFHCAPKSGTGGKSLGDIFGWATTSWATQEVGTRKWDMRNGEMGAMGRRYIACKLLIFCYCSHQWAQHVHSTVLHNTDLPLDGALPFHFPISSFPISHFPFSVPTFRVTPTSCRNHWCTHYPSLVPRLLHPQVPCSQPITTWRQALSTLYSAVGHGWNTQFTRPFPSLVEVVGLARLISSAVKLHSNNKLTVHCNSLWLMYHLSVSWGLRVICVHQWYAPPGIPGADVR